MLGIPKPPLQPDTITLCNVPQSFFLVSPGRALAYLFYVPSDTQYSIVYRHVRERIVTFVKSKPGIPELSSPSIPVGIRDLIRPIRTSIAGWEVYGHHLLLTDSAVKGVFSKHIRFSSLVWSLSCRKPPYNSRKRARLVCGRSRVLVIFREELPISEGGRYHPTERGGARRHVDNTEFFEGDALTLDLTRLVVRFSLVRS